MFLETQFYNVTVLSHGLLIAFILTYSVGRHGPARTLDALCGRPHIFFRYKSQGFLTTIQ